MPARKDVTVPDLVVLSLLAEKPRHGYEVNQELELRDVRDWAGISRPQVYYSLAKLAREKMIAPAKLEGEPRGPERDVYSITAAGRAVLRNALDRADWAEQRPPPPFLTWMALSAHAEPAVILAQCERRREFLQSQLARERRTLAGFQGSAYAVEAARAMVALTIRQFEVELEWLQSTKPKLQHACRSSH